MDALISRGRRRATPIEVFSKDGFRARLPALSERVRRWLQSSGFLSEKKGLAQIPGADGSVERVFWVTDPDGSPWPYAALPIELPEGAYQLEPGLDEDEMARFVLGWALGTYAFERYKQRKRKPAALVWPEGVDQAETLRLAEAVFLARDLVNTPACDLGPAELAQAARALAGRYEARCTVTRGEQLLDAGYPAVHAVGRAARRPPCLIDLTWGRKTHPKVTLVGKGVVFDSGGLDLKPASGMLLMKKDMGGAAMVLAVASAVMDRRLPVRLRVLIPAVENAVSGDAFRPLDVLQTRRGLTVEVGNTDAEGRLILCDALDEAGREDPEVIVDFATLTGAARVALGTDVPALFANDETLAAELLSAAEETADPLWRLPMVASYAKQLDSKVADLCNVSDSRYGGAIIAALFLSRFVNGHIPWAHIDLMAYNLSSRPGRPAGGEAMGVRAVYAMLVKRFEVGGGAKMPRKRKAASKRR